MECVEYIDENEYVTLYRMYGSGSIAEIPDRIAGKPVKALADHLFANESSVFYNPAQIRCAVLFGADYIPADAMPAEAEHSSSESGTALFGGKPAAS